MATVQGQAVTPTGPSSYTRKRSGSDIGVVQSSQFPEFPPASSVSGGMAPTLAPTSSIGSSSSGGGVAKIDAARNRFPYCVVWTPIPLLSWLFPMVGHMGICDSQGVIHDFSGSYFISEDSMLFGDPVKYWDLTPYIFSRIKELHILHGHDAQAAARQYDEALHGTTLFFRQTQTYNFFTNNCHSFVGSVMEAANINRTRWGMVKLVLYVMFFGKYISVAHFLKTHLPFMIIAALCFAFGFGFRGGSS